MDQLTLEGIVDATYAEAKLDPCTPDLVGVVRFVLGPHAIRRGERPIQSPAVLIRVRNEWQIWLSRSMPPAYERHAIGHELGHYLLRRHGYGGEGIDEERAADYLGAALLAPRVAFRAARRALGDDLPALASHFGITETGAALRLGEVTGQPLAIVAPAKIRVRGPEEWVWPDEATLRRWARKPVPGLRKTRLTDDPRRVMLDVDETG